MVRTITAIYSASNDPDFGDSIEETAILIAPDLIVEKSERGLVFLVIPEVDDNQDIVEVDRSECGFFALSLTHIINSSILVDYELLATCSLLEFVRYYAKK